MGEPSLSFVYEVEGEGPEDDGQHVQDPAVSVSSHEKLTRKLKAYFFNFHDVPGHIELQGRRMAKLLARIEKQSKTDVFHSSHFLGRWLEAYVASLYDREQHGDIAEYKTSHMQLDINNLRHDDGFQYLIEWYPSNTTLWIHFTYFENEPALFQGSARSLLYLLKVAEDRQIALDDLIKCKDYPELRRKAPLAPLEDDVDSPAELDVLEGAQTLDPCKSSTSNRLLFWPSDTLLQIFETLRPPDMTNMALVCRDWSEAAFGHLYHDVELPTFASIGHFARTVSRKADLGQLVHGVAFVGYFLGCEGAENSILRSCPNIRSVKVRNQLRHESFTSQIYSFTERNISERITSLHLEAVETLGTDILSTIFNLPNLRKLALGALGPKTDLVRLATVAPPKLIDLTLIFGNPDEGATLHGIRSLVDSLKPQLIHALDLTKSTVRAFGLSFIDLRGWMQFEYESFQDVVVDYGQHLEDFRIFQPPYRLSDDGYEAHLSSRLSELSNLRRLEITGRCFGGGDYTNLREPELSSILPVHLTELRLVFTVPWGLRSFSDRSWARAHLHPGTLDQIFDEIRSFATVVTSPLRHLPCLRNYIIDVVLTGAYKGDTFHIFDLIKETVYDLTSEMGTSVGITFRSICRR